MYHAPRFPPFLIGLAAVGLLFALWQFAGTNDSPTLSAWGGPSQGGFAAANGLSADFTQRGRGAAGDLRPQGNPLGQANTLMTQGYGVGSHAPAEVWGAIDLALDGNGDGSADPDGSWNQPIYATHYGVVTVSPESWPAGNHIWVANDQYRTGYAHLASFAVESGQLVQPGDLIGYIGSTGQSSGPHLDYQVWERIDGRWINVNPLNFGALDGTRR